ncbi:MAG: 1,4-dihydroxy-6-naphthoate synthase [Chitinophagaceae bacterium]
MLFTLGFSPCPNDTFIFDALVNKKIDTEDLDFEVALEDVQTINTWAMQGKLDITKLSYGVLPLVLDQYKLLNSGGALGKGVGPLLISNKQWPAGNMADTAQMVTESTIAIPGENTTANFLFSMAYPEATNKVFLRFDEIQNFVADGKGLGVIIHENRFTYQQKGMYKIVDLGDYWEQKTGNPIPLGGIVIRNCIPRDIQQQVDRLIRNSLAYSFAHYPEVSDYIRQHSQEMDEAVMRRHIDLYVNDFSIDLGAEGRNAVLTMMEVLGYHGPGSIFV